jgi:hypothetical protein
MKSPEKGNHLLHELLPCKTRERQSPSQWGYGERNERCVGGALLLIPGDGVVEFKVLEVREESDEIQDLPARAPGLFEGKESECGREVSKALLNIRHKAGYLEMVYSELLEVCERGEVRQGAPIELFGGELVGTGTPQTNSELFDEWKQTKLVRFSEWSRPEALLTTLVAFVMIVGREGMMKMGDGGNVPCQEGALVVNQVGDDLFHELLL